jgi:hypothetical protein
MRDSTAVYDVISAAVRGTPAKPVSAPLAVWERAIHIEGCGAFLERARRTGTIALAPAAPVLRAEGETAVRQAVVAFAQISEIARVARWAGARVLFLKGSARLLAGERPGQRSINDIDLLVAPGFAVRLHRALQDEGGYTVDPAVTPDRHLPMLVHRSGTLLPVEIHEMLTDDGSPLDRAIWHETETVVVGDVAIEIPSPTARVLHTLTHAIVVHRTVRYRLRDVLDVATVCAAPGVDHEAVRRAVHDDRNRAAMVTLLAAAGVAPYADQGREARAWKTVRRVAVARLAVPARAGVRAPTDPLVYVAGQLAEGSAAVVGGLAWRALSRPRQTAATVRGFVARAVRGVGG